MAPHTPTHTQRWHSKHQDISENMRARKNKNVTTAMINNRINLQKSWQLCYLTQPSNNPATKLSEIKTVLLTNWSRSQHNMPAKFRTVCNITAKALQKLCIISARLICNITAKNSAKTRQYPYQYLCKELSVPCLQRLCKSSEILWKNRQQHICTLSTTALQCLCNNCLQTLWGIFEIA